MENAASTSQSDVKQDASWPVRSQEHLIKSSKQNLFQKVPRRLKGYFVFALFLLLIISIFSLTVFLALKKYRMQKVCTSPECVRSASNLLQSLNLSVNPCDDFYRFACDNWRSEHVMEEPRFINNWFEERNKFIVRDILEFLEQEDTEDEPVPVHQARTVYQACLDFDSINKNGMESLWRALERLGLPRLPPVLSPERADWLSSVAKVRRLLGRDLLIGFTVMTSLSNSSLNQLAVATTDDNDIYLRRRPSLLSETVLERRLERGGHEVIRLWKEFSTKVMGFIADKLNFGSPDMELSLARASLRILQIKQNLSQIESSDDVAGPYLNDIPDEMEIGKLQELVDNFTDSGVSKIHWESYFNSIFEDVEGVTLDFESDKILVYKKSYFELISELLEELSEEDLELYVWWEVVYALAPHAHEELKTLKDIYTSKVLSAPRQDTRSTECVRLVYAFMDPAVGYLTVSRFDYSLVDTISTMISNIQEAFVESITDLSWMDAGTKKATVEKIRSIRKFIGIPEWIADGEQLESLYNVTVNTTTHLDNLLVLMDAQVLDTLLALRLENNNSISQFNPLDINAYYDPSGNAISVPAAIMQFPFYDLGLESLNYGAIGSILGHEVTHGLDSYGRKFDLNGNLNSKWWSQSSTAEFEKRTACFVKSYNNYFIPAVNGTVNGNVTLAENLADDGGLRNAFLAYRRYTNNFEYVERKLPGLEQFSQKQLFFIAHANMWCSEYTEEALSDTLDYDEHSPQFVRVNKVVQNMPEFAKAWGCPQGAAMHPDEKCSLWAD